MAGNLVSAGRKPRLRTSVRPRAGRRRYDLSSWCSSSHAPLRPPWFGAALIALAIAIATPTPVRAQQTGTGVFGSMEFRADTFVAIPQWERVIRRIDDEQAVIAGCLANGDACPSSRVESWRRQIESVRSRDPMTQLQEINRFVNNIVPYTTDSANYGVSDYWASPLEFLRRAGDCEDYSIAKYVSLLELGFRDDQMRIVVVMDVLRNLPHAVLSVRINDRNYILDSLVDVVLEDRQMTQYEPQYSVNRTSRWAHLVR